MNLYSMHKDDEIITLPQVAKVLKVSVRTVRRLIDAGHLECLRLGPRTTRVRSSALRSYLYAAGQPQNVSCDNSI